MGADSTPAAEKIKVLCVDDHRIVREGLSLIVGRQPDMEVVGTAASGQEAIDLARKRRPDVTLMDLQMSPMGGLQAIRAILGEDPARRIVVLTMYQGDEDIYRALKEGAAAYLLKDSLSDDLVRVIRQVHSGEHPVAPEVAARLAERATKRALTARETQVVELVAQGMRNKEVAAALGISEETVQVHVKNILDKLDVQDRTAAITAALRRGIIHLS